MADYIPLTNLRGPAARISAATAEDAAAGDPTRVVMTGPDQDRQFHFKIKPGRPGLPGVNAVANDQATATYVRVEDSETRGALDSVISNLAVARTHGALSAVRARLSTAYYKPARIVALGSSTTAGSKETTKDRHWFTLLIRSLQGSFTGEQYPEYVPSGAWSSIAPDAGVQGFNCGLSGATSANYLPDSRVPRVTELEPVAVLHMIGANDWAPEYTPIAQYKANIESRLNAIDAGTTTTHILIHSYRKNYDRPLANPWSDYRDALQEIAAERDNVAFINLEAPFVALGIPGPDVLGLLDPDQVHTNDDGHALIGSLMLEALGVPARFRYSATAPFDIETEIVVADWDAATLALGAVASWASKRGTNGGTLTQASAAGQPTALTWRGKKAVSFDGATDWLDSLDYGSAATVQPFTVITVFQSTAGAASQRIHDGVDSLGALRLAADATGKLNIRTQGSTSTIVGPLITTNPTVAVAAYASTSSYLSVDGVFAEGTVGNSTAAFRSLRLGRAVGGGGITEFFGGVIARVIVVPRRLLRQEAIDATNYLRSLYGIAG